MTLRSFYYLAGMIINLSRKKLVTLSTLLALSLRRLLSDFGSTPNVPALRLGSWRTEDETRSDRVKMRITL